MLYCKPKRLIKRVFIHCSASDHRHHDDVSVMDRWHRQRGWTGVGYHFFIRKDGLIQQGRPLERTPAAQRKHNRYTVAICLHGLSDDLFTEHQFRSLRNLSKQIKLQHNNNITFHGHCEVAAKTCPVFDYKSVLELDYTGRSRL